MRQKTWVYSPPKPKEPDSIKVDVEARAIALVNDILKLEHVKPPPKNAKRNYIIDLFKKWRRNYFYFCARYACPGPNALSPFFDTGFACLESVRSVGRKSRFNLSYMRHTGKWWEIRRGLSLEQCLMKIKEGGLLHP